MNTVTTRINAL